MLAFDTRQRPARPSEWVALLDAVYNADPNDEQHWIEWKSSTDFNSLPAVAKHICKAIIGFANREPDEAASVVGGIGILIIGLQPGKATGVQRLDNADLDQKVSPFIGTDGPIWQPHWYQYKGADVLIVEVGAPRRGDPIHCFRRATDGFSDGDIYVRHKARTTRANNSDVQRLAVRQAHRAAVVPSLDLELRLDSADPLSRYTFSETDLDRYLSHERSRLIEPLRREQRPKPRTTSGLSSLQVGMALSDLQMGLSGVYDKKPEPRAPDEYEQEVADYLTRLREAWPAAIREVATYVLSAPEFIVTNLSSSNYRQLEVRVKVAGDADVERSEDDDDARLGSALPEAPRPWGPIVRNYLDDIVRSTSLQYAMPSLMPTSFRPSTRIDRGGSFALTFVPVDLRPGQREVLEDGLVLLIPASRSDPVIIEWTATATNVDTIAQGAFEVDFSGTDLDAGRALADALMDDESKT